MLMLHNDHDVTIKCPVAVDELALSASNAVVSPGLRTCTWCMQIANTGLQCRTLYQMQYHMRAK